MLSLKKGSGVSKQSDEGLWRAKSQAGIYSNPGTRLNPAEVAKLTTRPPLHPQKLF
jgi:hypothetical protein